MMMVFTQTNIHHNYHQLMSSLFKKRGGSKSSAMGDSVDDDSSIGDSSTSYVPSDTLKG